MDNAKFAKFARDCGLLDKNLTSTDVDLVGIASAAASSASTASDIAAVPDQQGSLLLSHKSHV